MLAAALLLVGCSSSPTAEQLTEVEAPLATSIPDPDQTVVVDADVDPQPTAQPAAASDEDYASATQSADDEPPPTPDTVPEVPTPGPPVVPGVAGAEQASAGPILIAGEQLVLMTPGESPTVLIDEPVLFALDDMAGGLLLQMSQTFPDASPPPVQPRVWWVPAGAAAAQELLVPGDGQHLYLEDVAVIDGTPTVLYVRRTGGLNPETTWETLRAFDLDLREVQELATVGGWESGVESVSGGGNRIVTNWYAEASHGIDLRDSAGADVPGPDGAAAVFQDFSDCSLCPRHATLTADGATLFYIDVRPSGDDERRAFLVGIALADGEEIARIELPFAGELLDAHRGHVLVNRGRWQEHKAVLIEVATGDVTELPVVGTARFAHVAPDVGPIQPPVDG